MGTAEWTIAIATLFNSLSLDDTCPTLITQDECHRAVLDWQRYRIGLFAGAGVAFFIILVTTYVEAKRTQAYPERCYPLGVLVLSHCLFVVSWSLCTLLASPSILFDLAGTEHWVAVNSNLGFFAVTMYTFGVALWIIALVRVFYACWRTARERTPARALSLGESERDVVLQDV